MITKDSLGTSRVAQKYSQKVTTCNNEVLKVQQRIRIQTLWEHIRIVSSLWSVLWVSALVNTSWKNFPEDNKIIEGKDSQFFFQASVLTRIKAVVWRDMVK